MITLITAYLQHMADEINYLTGVADVTTIEVIINDPSLKRAVVRSIEVLGEASKNVSQNLKHQYPGINWEELYSLADLEPAVTVVHAVVSPELTAGNVLSDPVPLGRN